MEFILSQPFHSWFHVPAWQKSLKNSFNYHLFYNNEQTELLSVCTVQIDYGIRARTEFGPICKCEQDNELVLEFLKSYYKKHNYWYFSLLPSIYFSETKNSKREIGSWSTILIDLTHAYKQDYSRQLLRKLKAASKINLQINELELNDLPNFVAGYTKMYQKRGLAIDLDSCKNRLNDRFLFYKKYRLGAFYGVFYDNTLIGGMMISKHQQYAFYELGFTDSNFRHIPVLYSGFDKLLELLKNENYTIFDYGGYDENAQPQSQTFGINRFKLQFSQNIISYPSKQTYIFKPFLFKILQKSLSIFNKSV